MPLVQLVVLVVVNVMMVPLIVLAIFPNRFAPGQASHGPKKLFGCVVVCCAHFHCTRFASLAFCGLLRLIRGPHDSPRLLPTKSPQSYRVRI